MIQMNCLMKFLLKNFNEMLKKTFFILLLVLNFFLLNAQDNAIPEPPAKPSLVVDLTKGAMLSESEIQGLEAKLDQFNESTSNQIAIVFVNDLQGNDPSDFADRLAIKWKIGQKGLDNGILILVKPKTISSRGEVQIRIGKGLEGIIPDLKAFDIIQHEIIPQFKQGNYYAGLDNATNVLMALAKKEITYKDYQKKYQQNPHKYGSLIIFLVMGVVFLLMNISRRSTHTIAGGNTTGSSLPFWATMFFLGGMGGGGGSSGHWDDFSSGGGDFGGFGGGDFGGGGAGGSW